MITSFQAYEEEVEEREVLRQLQEPEPEEPVNRALFDFGPQYQNVKPLPESETTDFAINGVVQKENVPSAQWWNRVDREESGTFQAFVVDPIVAGARSADNAIAYFLEWSGLYDEKKVAETVAKNNLAMQEMRLKKPSVFKAFDYQWDKASGFFEALGVVVDYPEVVLSLALKSVTEGGLQIGGAAALGGTAFLTALVSTYTAPFASVIGTATAFSGFLTSNVAAEIGAAIDQELQKKGFDTKNSKNILELLQNPKEMAELREFAIKKGVTTSVVDSLLTLATFGLVNKATSKPLTKFISTTITEPFIGVGGEAAGQLVASGELDPKDLALEFGVGALASPISTVQNKVIFDPVISLVSPRTKEAETDTQQDTSEISPTQKSQKTDIEQDTSEISRPSQNTVVEDIHYSSTIELENPDAFLDDLQKALFVEEEDQKEQRPVNPKVFFDNDLGETKAEREQNKLERFAGLWSQLDQLYNEMEVKLTNNVLDDEVRQDIDQYILLARSLQKTSITHVNSVIRQKRSGKKPVSQKLTLQQELLSGAPLTVTDKKVVRQTYQELSVQTAYMNVLFEAIVKLEQKISKDKNKQVKRLAKGLESFTQVKTRKNVIERLKRTKAQYDAIAWVLSQTPKQKLFQINQMRLIREQQKRLADAYDLEQSNIEKFDNAIFSALKQNPVISGKIILSILEQLNLKGFDALVQNYALSLSKENSQAKLGSLRHRVHNELVRRRRQEVSQKIKRILKADLKAYRTTSGTVQVTYGDWRVKSLLEKINRAFKLEVRQQEPTFTSDGLNLEDVKEFARQEKYRKLTKQEVRLGMRDPEQFAEKWGLSGAEVMTMQMVTSPELIPEALQTQFLEQLMLATREGKKVGYMRFMDFLDTTESHKKQTIEFLATQEPEPTTKKEKVVNAFKKISKSIKGIFTGENVGIQFLLNDYNTLIDILFNRKELDPALVDALKITDNVQNQKAIHEDYLRFYNQKYDAVFGTTSRKDRALRMLADEEKNIEVDGVRYSKAQVRYIAMVMQTEKGYQSLSEKNGLTDKALSTLLKNLNRQDFDLMEVGFSSAQRVFQQFNELNRIVNGSNLKVPSGRYVPLIVQVVDKKIMKELVNSGELVEISSSNFEKERIKEPVKIDLRSDTEVLLNYFAAVSEDVALKEQRLKIKTFFQPSVMRGIAQKFGQDQQQITKNLVDLILSGRKQGSFLPAFGQRIIKNATVAQIALKATILAKQLTSIIFYSSEMPVFDFVKGFTSSLLNSGKAYETMLRVSPLVRERGEAQDIDIITKRFGETFEENLKKVNSVQQKIIEIGTFLTRFGDKAAIVLGGHTYYQYLIKQGFSEQEAVRMFEDKTAREQQSSDLDRLTILQNNLPWVIPFSSAGSAINRVITKVFRDLDRGKISKVKALKVLGIFWVINAVMIDAISFGDFNQEEWMERSALSPIGNMPLLSAFSSIINSYFVEGDRFDPNFAPSVQVLGTTLKKVGDVLKGEEDEIIRDLVDAGLYGSQLVGIGGKQILNLIDLVEEEPATTEEVIARVLGLSKWAYQTRQKREEQSEEDE